MLSNHIVRGLLGYSLAELLVACGSMESPSTDHAGGSPNAQAAANEARDPCSLITEAEAEAILGADLVVQRAKRDPRTCVYAASSETKLNGFTMTVYWKQGKEVLADVKGAQKVATSMMKSDDVDPSSMMSLEPVPELGDEAYFNPMVGTTALQGDVLLEFDIRAMMWHQTREPGRELWKRLAATALARL